MEKKRSRLRLFLENFFAYGVMGVLQKAISVIMLPILTRLITDTADFGTYDMYSTLSGFGWSLVSLGLYDALFREYFERDDPLYRKTVMSTAMRQAIVKALIIGALIAALSVPLSRAFLGGVSNSRIVYYAAIFVSITCVNSILIAPLRVDNKRALYIGANLIQGVVNYALAIILIRRGHSYEGMIWAMLSTTTLMGVFCAIAGRSHFDMRLYDRKVSRELLRVGLPMAPMSMIYWVFSSMDKVMITNMIGLAPVGVYSIGSKVASVSQLIYTAFTGGWQYFALSTMHDADHVEMTSKVMEYLAAVAFFAAFALSLADDFIFRLFFVGDYVNGVIVFPYLFLSPLLLMLYRTIDMQFLVVKKLRFGLISVSIGCAVNLVLNYFGITWFGIKGAAMATMIGYAVSFAAGLVFARRLHLVVITRRFLIMCGTMTIFMACQFFVGGMPTVLLACVGIGLSIGLYWRDAASLVRKRKDA